MKKYLLNPNGKQYKANLHCHSTISDGRLTIEQLKEEYMKRGYSIIAYTDHETYGYHEHLTDENFLALAGYEAGVIENDERPWNVRKVYHLNVYDKHPSKDKTAAPINVDYHDIDGINAYIKARNDEGCLVCYNHAQWSLQQYPDYIPLEGLFAMEVYNTGCAEVDGNFDYNNRVYDDMLWAGKRLFPVASDDNHNVYPLDSHVCDSFVGCTYIAANELTYDSVISAMENGDLYASTGATIDEIYYEDGKIHLKFPKASKVYSFSNMRTGEFAKAKPGENLTEATFTFYEGMMDYIRFEVVDTLERRAYTRAFTKEELLGK